MNGLMRPKVDAPVAPLSHIAGCMTRPHRSTPQASTFVSQIVHHDQMTSAAQSESLNHDLLRHR